MNGLAVLLAFFFAGQEPPPHARVPRAAITYVERDFDGRLTRANAPDSFDLLGPTRGVYVEGFGAVFSTEINLIISPNLSPFHQRFTKAEIARIRERKLQRLPLLETGMRQMLVASASALETLPPNEQIVLAVTLFRYSWEDSSGLPTQIVMEGERQKLLSESTREAAIRTVEY